MYPKMIGGTVIVLMLSLLVDGRHGRHRPTGLVKQHAKNSCKEEGKDIYKMHNADWWCCNCEAGYYKAADCGMGDPTNTTCKACVFDPKDSNNQTFTPTENNSTHCYKSPNESLCENSMNTDYVPGSPTKSSSCMCKDGFFPPVTTDVQKYGCNRHSVCYPGFQPAALGTSDSDTRCEKCPDGTFSNMFSATHSCMLYTSCETGERIVQQGTSIRDVVCSGAVHPDIFEYGTTNAEVTTYDDGNTRFIMDPCQRQNSMRDVTGFMVYRCEIDGTFERKQCSEYPGDCFCVHPDTGEEIDGSRTTDTDLDCINYEAQDHKNVLVPVLACFGVGLLLVIVLVCVCRMKRNQKLNGRNRSKKEHVQNPNKPEDRDEHLSSDDAEDACEGGEAEKFVKQSDSDEQSKRRVSIVPVVKYMKNFAQEIMPRKSESESCEITIADHEKPTIQNTTPLLAPAVDENDIEDCKCRRNSECKTAKSCSNNSCGNMDNKNSLNRDPCQPTTTCLETEIERILSKKWPSEYMCDLPSLRENIENCLKDHNLGWKLFFHLQKHETSDLKPYMRRFLSDTEISDEEENHRGNAKEIKYQWCSACKNKLGQTLTPYNLFSIEYEHKVFRDDMMEVFVENFKPRKEN